MKKKYYHILVVITMLFIVTFYGCKKDNSTTINSGQTIDQIINSNPDYSLFAYALKKSKLDVFSKGSGPFTFFVPTNEAFSKLSFNGVSLNSPTAIDNLDSNSLVRLITYHIQAGARTYYEIPLGPNATMSTQGGYTQYGSRYADTAYINGVKLLDKGTTASNGVIYALSNVLVYGYSTISDYLNTSNFSLMQQAITKTSVLNSFTASPSTVFLVPNNVMIAGGYDSVTIAGLSGSALTTLSNILKYHVIPQRIFISDFKSAAYSTRLSASSKVTVTVGSTVKVKGNNNAAPFNITGGNINISNGVAYTIDGILKP